MSATNSPILLRHVVAARVADMPAHETRFWTAMAAAEVDGPRAQQLLDTAVRSIAAGRSTVFDPYRLALSWARY